MAAYSEIERALMLNAWGYDDDDMEMVAMSLTEDAEMIIVADELVEDPAILSELQTVGRDAIIAQMTKSRAGFAERGERPRHVLSNLLVEHATTDEARTRCLYTFCVQSAAGLDVLGISRYDDRLIKVDGDWRIRERRNTAAHVGTRRSGS